MITRQEGVEAFMPKRKGRLKVVLRCNMEKVSTK